MTTTRGVRGARLPGASKHDGSIERLQHDAGLYEGERNTNKCHKQRPHRMSNEQQTTEPNNERNLVASRRVRREVLADHGVVVDVELVQELVRLCRTQLRFRVSLFVCLFVCFRGHKASNDKHIKCAVLFATALASISSTKKNTNNHIRIDQH